MFFPVYLVGAFFLILNYNHKVLYAPSDYKNEDNFLKSFGKTEKLAVETAPTVALEWGRALLLC